MARRLAAVLAVLVWSSLTCPARAEDTQEAPSLAPQVPDSRPRPWLGLDATLAIGGWQIALLGTVNLGVYAPLHRSASMAFQRTSLGGGLALEVCPGYVTAGPRLFVSPIDVFSLTVEAAGMTGFHQYAGFLPYEQVGGKLDAERRDREDQAVPFGQAFRLRVQPVVQVKVGPVVALYSLAYERLAVRPPEDLDLGLFPYVYYARRDLVVRWRGDDVFEHQAVVAGEPLNGKKGPLLRAGATVRHRQALGSGDASTVLGGIVQFRPSPRHGWPTLTVMLLPYLRDADRAAPDSVPPQANLLVALRWQEDVPLASAVDPGR